MIHPLSDTQSENIGDGTHVWQFTVILPGAVIGRDCSIGANCFIENDVRIGDGVTIKNGVQVWDRIVIEDGVFVGRHAMIGAGSVVTRDVTEFSLLYGNPARIRERVNEKGDIVERQTD